MQAFDRLYDASNGEINPMRKDPNQPIHPLTGIGAMGLAKFPVEYDFDTNEHGIKRLVPDSYVEADLYDYMNSLEFPGEVSQSAGAWTLQRDKNFLRCGRYDGAAKKCYMPSGLEEYDEPRLASNDEIHPFMCCSGEASFPTCSFDEPLVVTEYQMINGGTGLYDYHDLVYEANIGGRKANYAPLAGSTGDLTDGIIATQIFYSTGQTSSDPFVAWDFSKFASDGHVHITFFFGGSETTIGSLKISVQGTKPDNGIGTPASVSIRGISYAFPTSASNTYTAEIQLNSPIVVAAGTGLELQIARNSDGNLGWLLVSEIAFFRCGCPNVLQMDSEIIPVADRCPRGTFDEAVSFCARHGGRLCSSEELKNNCAAGARCRLGQELVWAGYTYEYSAETGCLSSQHNYALSREATKACDDSMALLVGSSTSVGALARLAEVVNDPNVESARERLPIQCCLDTPLDSEYFGYNVS